MLENAFRKCFREMLFKALACLSFSWEMLRFAWKPKHVHICYRMPVSFMDLSSMGIALNPCICGLEFRGYCVFVDLSSVGIGQRLQVLAKGLSGYGRSCWWIMIFQNLLGLERPMA